MGPPSLVAGTGRRREVRDDAGGTFGVLGKGGAARRTSAIARVGRTHGAKGIRQRVGRVGGTRETTSTRFGQSGREEIQISYAPHLRISAPTFFFLDPEP